MFDCLIIGAGPAGLTAGIYLQRFYRSVIIVDNGQSRASKIRLSNNYPGFPNGIKGEELLARLRQQLEKFGGEIRHGTVTSVRKDPDQVFSAEFNSQIIGAKTVLLATGVVDIEPNLEGYEGIRNSNLVRFCPICDGFEHSDQRIAIIGSGIHGVRESEFIKNFSPHVSFICLAVEPAIRHQAHDQLITADIPVLVGAGSKICISNDNDQCIDIKTTDGLIHQFDALYCALGCRVRSDLALSLGASHDEQHGLIVDQHLETSVSGSYAAGDVVSGLDQLAVATGQAAIASTAIHNRLRKTE